jgi:hypothetical protein
LQRVVAERNGTTKDRRSFITTEETTHQEDINTCDQGNIGASTSGSTPVHFPRDYVPPRKPSKKMMKLQKEESMNSSSQRFHQG